MPVTLRRDRSRDRGVTLLLTVLVIIPILIITALVIDHGFVRQNRQDDKSATDFAAAAGIRALDNGAGSIQVWKGICAAKDYLVSNNDELSPLTAVDASGTPVTDPCLSPPATMCTDAASYGTYRGIAAGGRFKVTIQNGYVLATSGFVEDSVAYSGDGGTDPCDHLGVIVEETEGSYFGGIIGSTGTTSTIRSVARLTRSNTGTAVAALVLLERNGCNTLQIDGGSGAKVVVAGNGATPGMIHSDSLGNSGCDTSNRIFDVNGASTPVIVAQRAVTPASGPAPGQITAYALSGAPGASTAWVTAPSPSTVCAQIAATDCTGTTGGDATSNTLVTRSVADSRYRSHVAAAKSDADTKLATNAASALVQGYDVVSAARCTEETFSASKVFIDSTCDLGGRNRTFTSTVQEIVVQGSVTIDNREIEVQGPAKVFIDGSMTLSGPGAIRVNNGNVDTCPSYLTTSAQRGQVVVAGGALTVTNGVLQLCRTTLLMTHNPANRCRIPSTDGTAPVSNSSTPPAACAGRIDVSGRAVLDWTAPNTLNTVASSFSNFEDLAFWTETSGGNKAEGNGAMRMGGIFVTPNADPFRIAGNGTKNTTDAQFLTRRLQVAGNGTLSLSPDPENAIAIPSIGGYSLVR